MNAIFACAVCFGQSDSPMAQATNMGIFLMLGVVAVVLVSFAMFFIHLSRQARLAASSEANASLTAGQAITGARRMSGPDMSRGTV